MSNQVTEVTEEKFNTDLRLKAINEAVTTLINLCKPEPVASIILSVCIPKALDAPDEENDGSVISIYAGDPIDHINQLDLLAKTEPDFIQELMIFLDIRIKRQMEASGTTGNDLADQLLVSLANKNKTIN